MNEAIDHVKQAICQQQLGKAIALLENLLLTYPLQHEQDQLTSIKTDYQLMADCWLRSFADPQREQVYGQLLQRLYVLTANVQIRHSIRNTAFAMGVWSRVRSTRKDWSVSALKRDMEDFVSGEALTGLQPPHIAQQQRQQLYKEHQLQMADLFDYIWTSRQWGESLADAFEDILLSPTVATIDQQLIVSAITLSAINVFDVNKFRLLVNVYTKSADDAVRQRALVGWVLTLDDVGVEVYPKVAEMVAQTVADEQCRKELSELQIQMTYCINTENDNRKIQSEIMPELLKNNNFRVTPTGIEEVDDDPMEDVLHPEAAEQRMERLEQSMQQMMDMQKRGADIYFSGFSQMKRFRFFDRVSNWFVPFYLHHPDIADIIEHAKAKQFLTAMTSAGPFCDSDKYSFVLAYNQVVSRIPPNMMEMLDRGEASVIGLSMNNAETRTPAYQRRLYLQNLYRFFRVHPSRSWFANPFDRTPPRPYLFFARKAFQGTPLEVCFDEITAFLLKQKMYDEALAVLSNYSQAGRGLLFYVMNGQALLATRQYQHAGYTTQGSFEQALLLQPDHPRALSGYARAAFAANDYTEALKAYAKLVELKPTNLNAHLNLALCHTKLGQYHEAEQILYKLSFDQPDHTGVNRILAWTLVADRKYEQAERIYVKLLEQPQPAADDLLNYGYCLWFKGDVVSAVSMFRQYLSSSNGKTDPEKEFDNEQTFLEEHGISFIERQLMLDLLRSNYN